jgi:DNA topoisomerase-6 subunit B
LEKIRTRRDAPEEPLDAWVAVEDGADDTVPDAKSDVQGNLQGNGRGNGRSLAAGRRATAQSMAASQRDISVSEFFAKNRHLLGFDNPRKALLTTVKEAVDNALDACEEAGILPEVWVHIRATEENRFQVGVQDNGPGILKKQIPLIFGKLLYGSKFHRLRMSRGQQGIGISAAGMYGLLTTGKPVRIFSKIGKNKPGHYYEIQIDTKRNQPEILNGRGEGDEVPCGDRGRQIIDKLGIEWIDTDHGTRVSIELEARYQRGRGSVDEYLELTALANPHVTLHYVDPEGNQKDYPCVTDVLPREPKEIKPHPYGVELGMLVNMLKSTRAGTLTQFLTQSFSRVSSGVARKICEAAKLSPRAGVRKIGRHEADALYKAIQTTRIPAPATDCISPIGEDLLLKGLHQMVPGEFFTAATRPPAVYRGNPFQIEVGLVYGGEPTSHRVPRETLVELVGASDARTLRQFLTTTFDGIGVEAADKIIHQAKLRRRMSPGKLKDAELDRLHEAMQNVNVADRQTMNVWRYANRVPLQFQAGACAVTQTIMATNWRAYGLSQSRGGLPAGPVTVMVHMASVWVPFTSESKEAVAGYPEIQKELRLALQAVGRKLGMFMRRRLRVKHEGQRRSIFLRYLREVASAVGNIRPVDVDRLYEQLVVVANKKTSNADMQMDDRGRRIEDELGDNVIIVSRDDRPAANGNANAADDDD